MTKSELIAGMASESGLTKTDAEKALNAFLNQVEQALKQGEKVQLVDLALLKSRNVLNAPGATLRRKRQS